MPTISRFYGILIQMFFDDRHEPHFHANYAEYKAIVSIRDGSILAGYLPRRAHRLVQEWRKAHRDELLANWEHARRQESLDWIDPLE